MTVAELMSMHTITFESVTKESIVVVYVSKKSNKKYVMDIQVHFKPTLSDLDLVELAEGCKVAPLAYKMPDAFVTKMNKWNAEFPGSKPSLRNEKLIKKIQKIYEDNGIPKDKTFSWGAFIQYYQDRLLKVAYSNFFIIPVSQSFHYCRAFWMVLNFDVLIEYAHFRNQCCIAVASHLNTVLKKNGEKGVVEYASGLEMQTALAKLHKEGKFVLEKENPEFAKVPISDLKAGITLSIAAHGAFGVEHRHLLQARDIRMREVNVQEVCNKIKQLILNKTFEAFNARADMPAEVLMHDVDQPWWAKYHVYSKILRRCGNTYRRMMRGQIEPGKDTNQIKKPYFSYIGRD